MKVQNLKPDNSFVKFGPTSTQMNPRESFPNWTVFCIAGSCKTFVLPAQRPNSDPPLTDLLRPRPPLESASFFESSEELDCSNPAQNLASFLKVLEDCNSLLCERSASFFESSEELDCSNPAQNLASFLKRLEDCNSLLCERSASFFESSEELDCSNPA
ncbi:hypothetical protein J6590_033451 [Homalodisca vitripennis]|nr:hypothetical protein J6590_033451 [Homalodisca vitripennis]